MTESSEPKRVHHTLGEAVAEGPLPGIEELDADEQPGVDQSATADADEVAERAGSGDVIGGIAMK